SLPSLRGRMRVNQGEKLGQTEASTQEHELQDPYGITSCRRVKGLNGCSKSTSRHDTETKAGNSQTETSFHPAETHKTKTDRLQEKDENSILNAYRQFIQWRKENGVLLLGDIQFVADAVDYLVFTRSHAGHTLLCAFNFSAQEKVIELNGTFNLEAVVGHGGETLAGTVQQLSIPAYATLIARVI